MTQHEALEILKTGANVFLTGAPGAGKTHTLREYISYLKENNIEVAITASTGIAATHLGGVTIHSWSGLGIRDSLSPADIDNLETKQYLFKRYEATKVLIIDEISMLHHFRFDLLDLLARSFKRNERPFGGLQVVLCGDFFQLPPVTRPGEPESYFAYRSKIWNEMKLKICYLEEQHRQNDDNFLSVLNAIRENDVGSETLECLKERHMAEIDSIVQPTKLFTHNVDVDRINLEELEKLDEHSVLFQTVTRGKGAIVESLLKSCLAPAELRLKIGARVMFVKNSLEKGYVNGTLGIIEKFDSSGFPLVLTSSGKRILAEPEVWIIEEEGKIKAEARQVPLRLAWAITVHKSQGMSLDSAEIDLSKSFAPGMGYVALSRVRTLAGLKLLGFNHRALQIHPEIIEFDQLLKKESNKSLVYLEETGKTEILKKQKEFIERNASKIKKEPVLSTSQKTKVLLDQKVPLSDIAKMRNLKEESIIEHIETLLEEGETIDIEYIKKGAFKPKELEEIEKAFMKSFKNHGDMRLAPVKMILKDKFSYKELRLARLFIVVE